MKRIYIRVDGNEIIATGHVMRCLSIAEQVRKIGAEVTFVVADERPRKLIVQRGFRMDVLHTIWDDLDKEVDVFKEYIERNKVDCILLDSYFVTKHYMEEISDRAKIIYVDDLRRFLYPVHALISYNAFINEEEYIQPYREKGCNIEFLLGSRYVPLREEFSYVPFEVRKEVRKVLITTGGTDQLNVAGNLLKMLLFDEECKKLEYHVIVGCFNMNKAELLDLKRKYSNIHLHENVTNMSEWMRLCDVAISAAGTTTYELCACGIPTICIGIADNQEGAIRWQQNGYMQYAGNACKDMKSCLEQCRVNLVQYQKQFDQRVEVSQRMQSLVDGCGARRIAEYIMGEMGDV